MRLPLAQEGHIRSAMAAERADDCVSRMISGAASGFAGGAIGGAVTANWSEVPLVLRNKAWPALQRTGQQSDKLPTNRSLACIESRAR